MTARWLGVVSLPVAALLLAACQSGPASIGDGSYRAYAAAPGVGAVPAAGLVISGDTIAVTDNGRTTSAQVGDGGDAYVVCPPDGKGTPLPIRPALTIGTIEMSRPAVFGDCGHAKPARVTIVDLTSVDGLGGPFPFTRWVEFCDTADADCP